MGDFLGRLHRCGSTFGLRLANSRGLAWLEAGQCAVEPFLDADDQDRVSANYGANYRRLVEIKRKYDPDNVFHVNQNILP